MTPVENVIPRAPRVPRDLETISKPSGQNQLPLLFERFHHEPGAVPDENTWEEPVVDGRSGISPAQVVEEKLTRMLRDASLPVSHLQTRKLLRPR